MPSRPRPSPSPPRRRAGLTLVEVVLAMALLSIGASVLLTALSRCLAVVRVAKNYYEARHVLDLAELEHPVLRTTDEQGREVIRNLPLGPLDYGGFTFTRDAERHEQQEDLYVVRTRVSWSARGRQAFEEVSGYLYYTNTL